MNNSDFLSDAVALDLGKSGVKVAETLEIQVGEEWWRLINAAAVTDGKFFNNRSLPVPAIVGGTIHLGGFTKSELQMSGGWNPDYERFFRIHTIVVNDVPYFYSLAYDMGQTSASDSPRFRVWGEAEEYVNYTAAASVTIANSKCAYYDSANNRIVGSIGTKGVYHVIGSGTYATFYQSANKSSDFWTVEVFPEIPDVIYSFFFSSAGGVKVKKTTPVLGDNLNTQFGNVITNTGATALTAVTGYSTSYGVYPFYLRSAESVGVAWVDDASGQIGYVLESESWGTVRYLPAISGMAGKKITGFGTSYFSVEGEFFLFATNGYSTGNVTLDAGYAFPANFAIVAAFPNGDDTMRVFGAAGATLYGFDLTLSNMHLAYLGAAYSSWEFANYAECTKLYESGDLVLLNFALASKKNYNTAPVNKLPAIGVYNKSTNTLLWVWSKFKDATLFPGTYNFNGNYIYGAFFRFDGDLMFLNMYPYGYKRCETYLVPLASLAGCADIAAVDALLESSGLVQGVFNGSPSSTVWSTAFGVNGALVSAMHDDSYYYIKAQASTPYEIPGGYIESYRIPKTSRTPADYDGIITNIISASASSGTRMGIMGLQSGEGTYLYDNKIYDSTEHDNLIRYSGVYNYYWHMGFYNPVSRSSTPNKNIRVVGSSTYNMRYADTVVMPACGMLGEAASYHSYGTYVGVTGVSWDLSNRTGHDAYVWTAPFSPTRAFTDEWTNDVTVYFGAVSGGNLPYIKHSAKEGLTSGLYAVRVSDSEVFALDFDHVVSGGLSAFNPAGSYIVYRSYSGVTRMLNTGAPLTDGMGGGVGGGSEATQYIFEYLDRTFIPYPFAREGIRAELSNISKTTKITLPETQDNLIRGMLAAGTDFRGSRCILRRVFLDHMDEAGSDIVLLDGYIQDWSYVPGKKGIAFSVSKTLIDVGGQFPKRLMNMGCSHVFKGARCQYLGETGRCLKTKTFCTSLANQLQFGGFPWIAARQRRVMWK